ncbi:MAG: zinc-ribbon and DUF3426 domain-containing protein [Granulosicoccus sp.]
MAKPGKIPRSGATGASAIGSPNAVQARAQEKSHPADVSLGQQSLNPQTCCSNCQTVFEVSLNLLSSSDTRVRCGECLRVFDALSNLCESSEGGDYTLSDTQAAILQNLTGSSSANSIPNQVRSDEEELLDASAALLAGLANDTGSLDVTYSDFDLFSTDAGLLDVQYFDHTRETPQLHFDDVTDIGDETFNDTLFAQDVTVDARSTLQERPAKSVSEKEAVTNIGFITDDTQVEPLKFEFQDAEPEQPAVPAVEKPSVPDRPKQVFVEEAPVYDPPVGTRTHSAIDRDLEVPDKRSTPWAFRITLFTVVAILALSLYGYRERAALLNNYHVRPVLDSICGVLWCQLPPRHELKSLRAVERSVVSHPTVANALVIRFGIVNEASFSQAYPVLEIRLSDRAGRLVVRNRFSPSEYQRGWQEGDVLDSQKRLDIALAVRDPGNTAMSFELDFHKVK